MNFSQNSRPIKKKDHENWCTRTFKMEIFALPNCVYMFRIVKYSDDVHFHDDETCIHNLAKRISPF